jgi:hypothetical protein
LPRAKARTKGTTYTPLPPWVVSDASNPGSVTSIFENASDAFGRISSIPTTCDEDSERPSVMVSVPVDWRSTQSTPSDPNLSPVGKSYPIHSPGNYLSSIASEDPVDTQSSRQRRPSLRRQEVERTQRTNFNASMSISMGSPADRNHHLSMLGNTPFLHHPDRATTSVEGK